MSKFLDFLSEYLAHRKGLVPLVGLAFILINLLFQFLLPVDNILLTSNLFLHIGVIISILGLMLAWAL